MLAAAKFCFPEDKGVVFVRRPIESELSRARRPRLAFHLARPLALSIALAPATVVRHRRPCGRCKHGDEGDLISRRARAAASTAAGGGH